MNELSLADIDAVSEWYTASRAEQRTRFWRFRNNTSDFVVEVFLYEFRQDNGKPPAGYTRTTGVTVGAQNIERGGSRQGTLTVKIVADFADAGLFNVIHVPTGRVTRVYNFTDSALPPGRYFKGKTWGIRQTKVDDETALVLTSTSFLDDGTSMSTDLVRKLADLPELSDS